MLTLEVGRTRPRGLEGPDELQFCSHAIVENPIFVYTPMGVKVRKVEIRLVEDNFVIRVRYGGGGGTDKAYRVFASSFAGSDLPLQFVELIRETRAKDHGVYLRLEWGPTQDIIVVLLRFVKLNGAVLEKALSMRMKARAV